MTDTKPVRMWEPKRVGVSGAKEFVGKFRMKVPPGTKGAEHYTGKNDAGVSWDYYGLNVDSINGVVRWIDVRDGGEYENTIVLFLETDKALHQVTTKCDVGNLHTILNHFLGLGVDLENAHINISYWVRKKTDKDGNVKLNKTNDVIWKKDLYFRDVPVKFDFDQWRDFSQQNGLDWFQETRRGQKEWNFDAEFNFWMSKVAGVQRWLLKTPGVLPFCWNSLTACEGQQPWDTLTKEEIETAKEIYERVRGRYVFPFGRTNVSADDVAIEPDDEFVSATTPRPRTWNESNAEFVPMPTEDVTSYGEGSPDDNELPF